MVFLAARVSNCLARGEGTFNKTHQSSRPVKSSDNIDLRVIRQEPFFTLHSVVGRSLENLTPKRMCTEEGRIKEGLHVLLSNSQAELGRHFLQPRTKLFSRLCISCILAASGRWHESHATSW